MPPLLQKFVAVHSRCRRRCHGRTIHQPSRVVEKASLRRLWPSRHPGEFDPDPLSQLAQSYLKKVVEPEQGMSSPALLMTVVVVHPNLEEWKGQIGCWWSRQYLEWPVHTRSRLGPQCWQGDRSRQLQQQLRRRFRRRFHLR